MKIAELDHPDREMLYRRCVRNALTQSSRREDSEIVEETDIDSHELAAFGADDRRFVEEYAAMVARFMERTR